MLLSTVPGVHGSSTPDRRRHGGEGRDELVRELLEVVDVAQDEGRRRPEGGLLGEEDTLLVDAEVAGEHVGPGIGAPLVDHAAVELQARPEGRVVEVGLGTLSLVPAVGAEDWDALIVGGVGAEDRVAGELLGHLAELVHGPGFRQGEAGVVEHLLVGDEDVGVAHGRQAVVEVVVFEDALRLDPALDLGVGVDVRRQIDGRFGRNPLAGARDAVRLVDIDLGAALEGGIELGVAGVIVDVPGVLHLDLGVSFVELGDEVAGAILLRLSAPEFEGDLVLPADNSRRGESRRALPGQEGAGGRGGGAPDERAAIEAVG